MGRGVPTGERSQEKELGSVVHSVMCLIKQRVSVSAASSGFDWAMSQGPSFAKYV